MGGTPNQTLSATLLNASEFVLEGPKDLLSQLARDHNSHLERITGIATIPQPEGTTVETHEGTKGKTRVTTGVRVSEGSTPGGGTTVAGDARLPVRLRVQSIQHVDDKCSPRS